MKHLLLQAIGSAADWVIAAFALLGIGGGGILGVGAKVNQRTKDNEERSKRNARWITGDDEDPNHEGLLSMAQETRQRVIDTEHKIDQLDRKMDEQHADLMERFEELAEDVEDDGDS